jgi:hypothetical protein
LFFNNCPRKYLHRITEEQAHVEAAEADQQDSSCPRIIAARSVNGVSPQAIFSGIGGAFSLAKCPPTSRMAMLTKKTAAFPSPLVPMFVALHENDPGTVKRTRRLVTGIHGRRTIKRNVPTSAKDRRYDSCNAVSVRCGTHSIIPIAWRSYPRNGGASLPYQGVFP